MTKNDQEKRGACFQDWTIGLVNVSKEGPVSCARILWLSTSEDCAESRRMTLQAAAAKTICKGGFSTAAAVKNNTKCTVQSVELQGRSSWGKIAVCLLLLHCDCMLQLVCFLQCRHHGILYCTVKRGVSLRVLPWAAQCLLNWEGGC